MRRERRHLRRNEEALGSLWTCPTCGVRLVTKNLAHSCGAATPEDWTRRMGPRARAFYRGFEKLVARCGPYYVSPAKTRITFLGRVRFAGITRLSEDGMRCGFALPAPLRSRRFVKVTEVVPGWWTEVFMAMELTAGAFAGRAGLVRYVPGFGGA